MTVQAAALRAEGEENTEREPFTPGEAVRHRKRLEAVEAAAAKARQAAAGPASAQKRQHGCSKLEQPSEAAPKPSERKTRALTAKGTGYSATSLDKAQKVVEAAEQDPSLQPVEPLARAERGQARFFPLHRLERALSGVCGAQLARLLRIHPRQLDRLRGAGLTYSQADELAVRAGFHPAEIWREWTCPLLALVDVPDGR